MYQDPDPPAASVVMVFPDRAKDLWLKALGQPSSDTKCKAAEAIARAHRRGVKGLETTIGPLRVEMDQPEAHPVVRLTIARTLVALEARETAPSLWRHAQAGEDHLREIVEPALARWDFRPAQAAWLDRLGNTATPPRKLVLAIQGLAAVQEVRAVQPILGILRSDRVHPSIRQDAAKALGLLCREGLEKEASRLAADSSLACLPSHLAAALLLHQHQSSEAIKILLLLADDREPAVVSLSVARLIQINPDLVLPGVVRHLSSPEAKVRLLGIEVLFLRPTDKHLGLLADKLEDVHPEVRLRARKHLRELARKKELRDKIINEATRVLGGKSWQGLEQATILLAQLDHKPAAGRLVELLAFPRPEVYVSAAWGLRVLAVSETLPGVVSFVIPKEEQLREAGARRQPTDSTIDHQLSQLNQFLGRQKYRPAEPVLRRFIPRMEMPLANPVGVESRAAAIWALGLIHEGKSVPDLAPALEERLNDVSSIPPEDFRVRRMSAITLGRIKAKEALTSLRNFCPRHQPDLHPVINACGWAVEKLTGETFPPPKPILRVWRDWFLTPN